MPFFTDSIGCDGRTTFRNWALVSEDGDVCRGNCTILERENDYIILSDEYPEEAVPTKLRMTAKQFIELFDEWQEKVVKLRPKEVVIKHEHGQFFIETAN